MTGYKLTHFKKMVRVWKTKSLFFCLRYDPLIVFRRQNHITFIFIKTMSHDLLVQMAYSTVPSRTNQDKQFVVVKCRATAVLTDLNTKSVLSTRGVAATFRPFKKFHERSRAVTCTEMCKISVPHVQSRQPVVVLLIKPLIIYWAFLLQSPDCSRCNC